MNNENFMQVMFAAAEENLSFARTAIASFVSLQNPTLSELTDLKTAVSEAVSNAIIHGYNGSRSKAVLLSCAWQDRTVRITVEDSGAGIADVALARQPLFTTRAEEERSGMGFTVMEMLCDEVEVSSLQGKGTRVCLMKTLQPRG